MHYVYRITFPNGKVYIGYTGTTPESRLKEHYAHRNDGEFPIKCALRKYSKTDVILDVLFDLYNIFGIKRDFGKSIIKRFKQQTTVGSQLKEDT
jgi:hypothetical protein